MTAGVTKQWQEAQLFDVTRADAPIGYGIVQPGPNVRDGVPVVAIRDLPKPVLRHLHRSAQGIEAAYERSRITAGDILISVKGTTGRIGIVPAGFFGNISRDVARLRLRAEHEPAYWFQLLQSHQAQRTLHQAAVGSTRQELSIRTLKTLSFRFPSQHEQVRIAAVLSDVDDLITTLERLIAKKQAIKQGMMQQLLTGRIRLPGFTGDWRWCPFPDVMVRINAKKYQILASAYSPTGLVPVVDQGQKPIIGYINSVNSAYNPGVEGVIVFGDHTCITKFVDFPFAVGADGTQLVMAKEGNSTLFMAYALRADPVVSTGYNRHFKFLQEKVLPVPVRDEQEAIAGVLDDVEAEIAALQVRRRKAIAIKTAMMQQLLTGQTRLPTDSPS